MSSAAKPALNADVFINCAFDPTFIEVFRAIVFAVKACGFEPRTVLDDHDSGTTRIDKISRLIRNCDRGIHDLSATKLDPSSNMPRFNMPLELGMSLGAKWYGSGRQRHKRLLVLDREPHSYDASTSDISGQDISVHAGDPAKAITCVRNWLVRDRHASSVDLPGGIALTNDWTRMRLIIDETIKARRLDPWDELTHVDFLTCLDEGLMILAKR